MKVSTAIALRHEESLIGVLEQITAMASQNACMIAFGWHKEAT